MSGAAARYRSYGCLAGALDLPFPLAPELNRVPPWEGGFTVEVPERSERLLAEHVTSSLHDHPVLLRADMCRHSALQPVYHNVVDGTAYVIGNTPGQHELVPYLEGRENPTENFDNLAALLVQDGYSDGEVAKVLGGNTPRGLQDMSR